MVDRVGERLLYCGIGIVTETLCFGLTGYFFDFFLNDIILEITEGISQLAVQRSCKQFLCHSNSCRVRLIHDFNACIVKKALRVLTEKHLSNVQRLPEFTGTTNQAHIYGNVCKGPFQSFLLEVASDRV